MSVPDPRVYLVDGSSYIFRAFFALPPLTNDSGLPTNAIYGFTNMILKLLKDHRPEYICIIFDAGRETFRNEIYQEYKGNRPEAPPNLVPQFPYIRKVLEAMDLSVLEMEGFEADDLIATLCKKLTAQESEVVVVTGDKDLMQLVSDSVRLLDTMKGKWTGRDEVKEKFGVEPEKVAEVMALMGDPIDNIPGVKGIGEKTAIALIQHYRTLENLFTELPNLEATGIRGLDRVRKALMEGKESAFLSRNLATVRTDVPIEADLQRFRFLGQVNKSKLEPLFKELGFSRLLKELNGPRSETA